MTTIAVPLSEPEKARIRYHLGYMQVAQSATFVLGVPASLETQFIIEGALKNLSTAEALGEVRRLIAECDRIEAQISENTENLAVRKVGSIELRDDEFERLQDRYNYWRNGLANAMGIVGNPFDKRLDGGISVPVRG